MLSTDTNHRIRFIPPLSCNKKSAMLINSEKTIKEVQEEFNKKFPGLQLNFYSKKHADRASSSPSDQVDDSIKLGSIKTYRNGGFLPIKGTMTVTELEQGFENHFGLHVQVYRNCEDTWIQTVKTDNWTLEFQNQRGINSNLKITKDGY